MSPTDHAPTLTDGVVTLRPHSVDDVESVYEQCQDPLSQAWTTVPVPYSRDDAKRFVREIVPGGWRQGSEWAFAVEAADEHGNRRFAGTVSLRPEGEGRAEVAYGSHPWARGRGVLERALHLLLDWGFTEQGLETVIWWANKGNWASRKLAWRLGFTVDGTVRHWLPQRGTLLDAWVGVLLASDKREPRNAWFTVPRITGEHLVLRAHTEEDLPRIAEGSDDERTRFWLTDMPAPYTLEEAEKYVAGRLDQLARGVGLSWAVADRETDLLLANIALFDLKPGHQADIGYWSHPAARGRGVMTEACGLVIRHAFVPEEDGGMGLKRLAIRCAETNTASRRVIEANGFVAVGRERRGTRLGDGSVVDTLCYDLLAEEYAG